jgi:8-oxo-dGTP pyrophosphatase MutT (NUDIX family)
MENLSPENTEQKLQETHFFEAGFEKAHTVVFFIDEKRQRIGMLKRSEKLAFAPNLYTGVGGKIEKGEGNYTGAARELEEELKGRFEKRSLKEFGRIIINGMAVISYFSLPHEDDALPEKNEDIGDLSWASFDEVMDLEIIPTTKYFMEEWRKRSWNTDRPFTVLMAREDPNDIKSPVTSISIQEDLVGKPPVID